jgi:6-phosphogluconate dehydrogenase
MIGGMPAAIERLRPALDALAPPDGWRHVGPPGAGHFAKMVHNGIEYGMMQAYGEGFELLSASEFGYDLAAIARLWNQGSVVRSWLLELTERAFADDPKLERIKGYVEDSGEGRWTVHEAVDHAVPAPVLALALFERFRSRQDDSFRDRMIAALRHQFGGHAVKARS